MSLLAQFTSWLQGFTQPDSIPPATGRYPVRYHSSRNDAPTAVRIFWENIAIDLKCGEELDPQQLDDDQNIEIHFANWLNTHDVTDISELIFTQKKLTSIPKEIGSFTELTILHLSCNKLYSLPDEMSKITCLRVLGLAFNKFTSIPDLIENLPELKEVDKSYNQISRTSAVMIRCLNLLNLEGNTVTSLLSIPNAENSSSSASSETREQIPKGFPNLGSTCYMNAPLHFLFLDPYFWNYVSQEKTRHPHVQTHLGNLLAVRTRQHAKAFRQVLADSGLMPDLADAINGQKDASEFVRALLDIPGKIPEDPAQSKDQHVIRIRTERKSLGGQYKQDPDVQRCHLLSLPLLDQPTTNLQKLIDSRFADSKHIGDTENPFKLDNGMELDDWIEINQLISNPDVIIIELIRFLPGLTKVMHAITLDENQIIDLSAAMHSSLIPGKSPLYRYMGQASHHGNRLESGHYTASMKMDQKWYRFNDMHVEELTQPDLKDAYLILLRRLTSDDISV